ncbi:hypothetical protein ACH5RR_019729 [Cinchona calisaya]|uniref:Late embryogenesis abundant protein LEA-2 subgroup domain-containing protein n=1 Tax=Cinchona calisaya TaxID=153742 RepID=A0ABD2ZTS2_9GENT
MGFNALRHTSREGSDIGDHHIHPSLKSQQHHTLEQSKQFNPTPRLSDEEEPKYNSIKAPATATMNSNELRKKKRLKCLAYIAAFVVFQTAIIIIFVLTIMKIRTPKFRVRSANLEPFPVGTPTNTSFNFTMQAELGVKNANFGNYKFQNSTIIFYYGGARVGEAAVRKTKAGWRSTKKLNILADLSSNGLPINSQLGSDLNSGTLTLNSQSTLNGKVELIFIFKKKKSIKMNCTLTINLAERAVRQISCT